MVFHAGPKKAVIARFCSPRATVDLEACLRDLVNPKSLHWLDRSKSSCTQASRFGVAMRMFVDDKARSVHGWSTPLMQRFLTKTRQDQLRRNGNVAEKKDVTKLIPPFAIHRVIAPHPIRSTDRMALFDAIELHQFEVWYKRSLNTLVGNL